MNRITASLGSLVALVGVVALALFLAGVFDGGAASGSPGDGNEVAGLCAEDHPDCEDTLVDPNGDDDEGNSIAPACAPGYPDCADTVVADNEAGELFDAGGSTTIEPMCVQGVSDCKDMLVVPDDDEIDGKIVPIGRFDEDNATGGSDDGDAPNNSAVEDGTLAVSDGATTPSE